MAALTDAAKKLTPDGLTFAVAHLQAQQFNGAGTLDGHDHDDAGPDLLRLARLPEPVSRVHRKVWQEAALHWPIQEGLVHGVKPLADATHLRAEDTGPRTDSSRQAIDHAGGDALEPGLHDHRVERLIDQPVERRLERRPPTKLTLGSLPPVLENRREEAPREKFRDRQRDVAPLGGERGGSDHGARQVIDGSYSPARIPNHRGSLDRHTVELKDSTSSSVAKLIGLARVKNEADFIEYFARHNARILDELYIVDDHSSDNTTEIILSLKQEGLVTELLSINDRSTRIFNLQGKVMTQLMHHAASKHQEEECYIFALDADEIILGDREAVIKNLRELSPNEYGLIRWRTFAPINGGLKTRTPLCESFQPLLKEQSVFYKAVIPIQHASTSNIEMGNHAVTRETSQPKARILDIELSHFPVRSADQIISKALVASHKTHLKNTASQGEGYHIIALARNIRRLDFSLSDPDLTSLALNYLAKDGSSALEFGFNMEEAFPPMTPKYHQKKINPIAALDELLKDIINKEACD